MNPSLPRGSFLLNASVLTASSYSNIVFHRDSDAVEQCQHSGKYYHKIYYPILKHLTLHLHLTFKWNIFDATVLLQVSLIIFSISIISSSNPQRPHYNLSTSSSRGLCMKGEAKSICLPPDYVKVSNFQ